MVGKYVDLTESYKSFLCNNVKRQQYKLTRVCQQQKSNRTNITMEYNLRTPSKISSNIITTQRCRRFLPTSARGAHMHTLAAVMRRWSDAWSSVSRPQRAPLLVRHELWSLWRDGTGAWLLVSCTPGLAGSATLQYIPAVMMKSRLLGQRSVRANRFINTM